MEKKKLINKMSSVIMAGVMVVAGVSAAVVPVSAADGDVTVMTKKHVKGLAMGNPNFDYDYDVLLKVTFDKDGKIKSVADNNTVSSINAGSMGRPDFNMPYWNLVKLDKIFPRFVGKTKADIAKVDIADATTGATYSGKAIKNAVSDAFDTPEYKALTAKAKEDKEKGKTEKDNQNGKPEKDKTDVNKKASRFEKSTDYTVKVKFTNKEGKPMMMGGDTLSPDATISVNEKGEAKATVTFVKGKQKVLPSDYRLFEKGGYAQMGKPDVGKLINTGKFTFGKDTATYEFVFPYDSESGIYNGKVAIESAGMSFPASLYFQWDTLKKVSGAVNPEKPDNGNTDPKVDNNSNNSSNVNNNGKTPVPNNLAKPVVKKANPKTNTNPKTGDASGNVALFLLLVAISAGSILRIRKYTK